MRFFVFASLSFLVLLVSAQTSGTNNPGLDGLLADLAKLPSCVVRIQELYFLDSADSYIRPIV